MAPDDRVGGDFNPLGDDVPVLAKDIGRFQIDRDRARLTVQRRDSNAVSIHGCLFTVFAAISTLALGVMGMAAQRRYDADTWSFLAPRSNHLGFLWVVSTIGLAVGMPVLMKRMHGAARQVVVDRIHRRLEVGSERIALRKVEAVLLQERRDPDERLLVRLLVGHTDGMECQVLEDYDEVAVRAVAAEMARYMGCPVRWIA